MIADSRCAEIELICAIVNYGLGSKVIKVARECGVSGGTITLGKGTINSRILDFLGLSDVRKEIVFLVTDESTASVALEELNKKFEFHRPNHGIVFTTSVCFVMGAHGFESMETKEMSAKMVTYQAITTIVDRGKAEEVIDAAIKAGSKGGTIINARGSGIHETSKVFNMEIEPEKEVVLILAEVDAVEGIVESIRKEIQIDEPGKGIIYVQDVKRAYGLYK